MDSFFAWLRVLIADGDPLMRWALSETLMGAGHTPIHADSAEAAIHAVRASTPIDVILLDYPLHDSQDRSTLSTLSTLRHLAPTSPVIVMTADNVWRVASETLGLGAHSVLHKHLELRTLPAIVEHANRCRPL